MTIPTKVQLPQYKNIHFIFKCPHSLPFKRTATTHHLCLHKFD